MVRLVTMLGVSTHIREILLDSVRAKA